MTFLRGILALVLPAAAYIGYEDLHLRLQCPAPVDLRGAQITQAPREVPVWATVEGMIPVVGPWVMAADTGAPDRVLLPFVGSEDPETAVAVVVVAGLAPARRLQAFEGPLRIEGIARPPDASEASGVEAYCREAGLSLHSGFRMLEAGRKPGGLAGSLLLFLGGTFGSAVVLAALAAECRRRTRALPAALGETIYASPRPESLPLPEEVKVEVHHMLQEVWDSAG